MDVGRDIRSLQEIPIGTPRLGLLWLNINAGGVYLYGTDMQLDESRDISPTNACVIRFTAVNKDRGCCISKNKKLISLLRCIIT